MTVYSLSTLLVFAGIFAITGAQHDADSLQRIDRRLMDGGDILPMRVGLRSNSEAVAKAEAWLMDVSDPDSPHYGQHWTQQEVIEAFRPTQKTVEAVKKWLCAHGVIIDQVTHTDNKAWLAFDLPVVQAEKMLQTQYYEHWNPEGRFEASCDEYTIPEHLLEHIDYIKPGVIASDVTGRTERSHESANLVQRGHTPDSPGHDAGTVENTAANHTQLPLLFPPDSLSHCDLAVTPACLRAMYNFSAPDIDTPVSDQNHLGIFQDLNLAFQGDLNHFYERYTDIPVGTTPMFKSIDGALTQPNETRHWTAKPYGGFDGAKAIHQEATLDIELAQPIIYPQNITIFQNDDPHYALLANRNAAGWLFNDFLDAMDGSYCNFSGLDEAFPKHHPVYPDPVPANRYNGTGWNGTRECGVFKPTPVISFSYEIEETKLGADKKAYFQRQCTEYLKLGLQGVSLFFASGDSGVGLCYNSTWHDRLFNVRFPSDCPWVTSVGATFQPRNVSVHALQQGVKFSTGGFSINFERPAYQDEAVTTYLDKYAPENVPYFRGEHWRNTTGRYNRDGRGIPDIAAVGTHIALSIFNHWTEASGTSASTPIVAALFNRIVEERLRAGKGPLGFVNPALYKNPNLLDDVLVGRNNLLCRHGFSCAPGWDAVTGLGTPDYSRMLDYFLSLP